MPRVKKRSKSAYSNFPKESLILRDELAIERTVLANERTFMAYIRTFVALFVVGATLIHFANTQTPIIVGTILVGVSIILLITGVKRYMRIRNQINLVRKK